MKAVAIFAMMVALGSGAVVEKDRTITKVVDLLQKMLEKSQKEGDEERVIYAKFKCYCDTQEAEKKESIKQLTEQIALLENEIAEIQGDTGGLSSECAELKVKMADNKAARDTAEAIRKKENKAYIAEKDDLTQAIKQMKEAIKTLSAVGADQTKSVGADNKQFMAGYEGSASLLSLQAQVKTALNAASALMTDKQQRTATGFLQAPFTGTYTSQSAEVMGIIKNMRDTFEKNLEEANAAEKAAAKAHKNFMKIKEEAFNEMEASYNAKQKSLGGNDKTLSTKKEQLADAKKQLASDEEFLEKLLPLCKEKAEGYEKRKVMRANEEAAIAEAVSILNSDAAFATFGGVDATSSGKTFLQLRSIRNHGDARQQLQKVLQSAKSARLSKVLALVRANNPFEEVLNEIDKMLKLIEEEGKQDKENLDWCNSERTENNDNLEKRKKEIIGLNEEIDKLDVLINHEVTGLKKQIENTEDELVKNKEAQTTQTAERLEDNVAYQKDIKNLVSAEGIVDKAIKVLKAYYEELAEKLENNEALVQEDPTPPEAWKGDGQFEGQSTQGNKVISQLEFILKQARAEETEAHQDEENAQASYEDSMLDLKKKEADAEKHLAGLQETLAEKEKELLAKREDLAGTIKAKETIEDYLAKIKPGCDFITTNFELRNTNRDTETAALKKAIKLIKGTPAYNTYTDEERVEGYGKKCEEPCVKSEPSVECQACLADVTIPAYCAGHDGTPGC